MRIARAWPPPTVVGFTLATLLGTIACYSYVSAADTRINVASGAHHLRVSSSVATDLLGNSQGQLGAEEGPGRPDRSDSDVPLLPMRSGDTINLRSVDLDLYCNVRDVQLDDPASAEAQQVAGSGARLLKSVLACSETNTDGPGGALLVVGTDFLTDEIREDSGFYLKSQRTNKFCAPQPLLSLSLSGPELAQLQVADRPGGGAEPLVVVCDKRHYDESCEWRAVAGKADPRVIYLQPAGAPSGRGRADEGEDNDRDEIWCGPRGRQGLLVCDNTVRAAGKEAALEVVRGGYHPGGGDGGDYPHGGGDYPHGGGDYPHGRGGGDYPHGDYPDGEGGADYPYLSYSHMEEDYPLASSYETAGDGDDDDEDDDEDYLNSYYDGYYGGGVSYEVDTTYMDETAMYYEPGQGGDDAMAGVGEVESSKKEKLPFHTGSMILLTSPHLEAACDTASGSSPYGPYGPYARTSDQVASQRESDSALGRRGGKGGDSGLYNPYDYGPSDDPSETVVWCNGSIPDGPSQYPPYAADGSQAPVREEGAAASSSSWWGAVRSVAAEVGAAVADAAAALRRAVYPTGDDAEAAPHSAAAATAAGQKSAVANSQWDLDGFVLMGTDFATADIFSGSRVFLKNQNTRKFCRVFGAAAADYESSLESGHLVCDRMTSGDDTEFVLELVALEELQEEAEGQGDKGEAHNGSAAASDGLVQVADALVARSQGQAQGEEEETGSAAAGAAAGGETTAEGGLPAGQWPDGSSNGGDWPSGGGGDDRGGYIPDGSGGDWPHGGGSKGKKVAVLVRLRAPTNQMRYCAPEPRLPGSPILCDLRHPDDSHRQLTTFRLMEAAPSYYPEGAVKAAA